MSSLITKRWSGWSFKPFSNAYKEYSATSEFPVDSDSSAPLVASAQLAAELTSIKPSPRYAPSPASYRTAPSPCAPSPASYRTAPSPCAPSPASYRSAPSPYEHSPAAHAHIPGPGVSHSDYAAYLPSINGTNISVPQASRKLVSVLPQVHEVPESPGRQPSAIDSINPNAQQPLKETEFQQLLAAKGLILPPDQELNWSGRGQHVEYEDTEDVPLQQLSTIGASITAIVDKVRCRRIILARKLMRCTRRWGLQDAIVEVGHLHRLRHPHIVQLVGTYLQGRNFAILIYPAADCNLATFMEDTTDLLLSEQQNPSVTSRLDLATRYDSLAAALPCLAYGLAYIHSNTTKHMDIKPLNILVKRAPATLWKPREPYYKIYIADFGLSRSFDDQGHSQTDGPTSRTPKYCAPEVYCLEKRGRSADIFSLGCVYIEIMTTYLGFSLDSFADFRRSDSDESFHNNLERVQDWITSLEKNEIKCHGPTSVSMRSPRCPFFRSGSLGFVLNMVSVEPKLRPSANELAELFTSSISLAAGLPSQFQTRPCCYRDPEPYVVELSTLNEEILDLSCE